MARVVVVHGIGHQFSGERLFLQAVVPALLDGVALAGAHLDESSVQAAAYGDLFRPAGTRAASLPPLQANDLEPATEGEMLALWWAEAARTDSRIPPPGEKTRARTPQTVQAALRALSQSAFFAGIAEQAMIWDLKQVYRYLNDNAIREAVQARIVAKLEPDTRILVAHSLGSVAAYETLCAHTEVSVTTLVTLGSPLGISNLIFDRLRPAPVKGKGVWPGAVKHWTNIADHGDVVALEKNLAKHFGGGVCDVVIYNGSHAHDCTRYLTAKETGMAIAQGLEG